MAEERLKSQRVEYESRLVELEVELDRKKREVIRERERESVRWYT